MISFTIRLTDFQKKFCGLQVTTSKFNSKIHTTDGYPQSPVRYYMVKVFVIKT